MISTLENYKTATLAKRVYTYDLKIKNLISLSFIFLGKKLKQFGPFIVFFALVKIQASIKFTQASVTQVIKRVWRVLHQESLNKINTENEQFAIWA